MLRFLQVCDCPGCSCQMLRAGRHIPFYLWFALFVCSSPSSMSPFFVMSLLCGLIFGQTESLCAPSEYTIHVEKRECAYCLAINTTICAGFCMTRVRVTGVSATATRLCPPTKHCANGFIVTVYHRQKNCTIIMFSS